MSRRQGLAAVCLVSVLLMVVAGRAQPAATDLVVVTVNTDQDGCGSDEGCVSLRSAIDSANEFSDASVINFDIGTGPKTIHLASPLPIITNPVTIDGTTQPGGTGPPPIEIDGSNAGTTSGLVVATSNSTIRGLVINHFHGSGVELTDGSSNVVAGNYIGTDASGTQAAPNTANGVMIVRDSTSNSIGGSTAADRNVISGNLGSGIAIASEFNDVFGNFVGTDASGTGALPNGGDGVTIDPGSPAVLNANFNRIGDIDSGFGNVIRFNAGAGVAVSGTTEDDSIRGNSISSNQALGIDLGDDGVTTNDVGDQDPGPNGLQNFPVFTGFTFACSAAASIACMRSIGGSLTSTPGTSFEIDFYASSSCDLSGHGEGTTYLGTEEIQTDNADGQAMFSFSLDTDVPANATITATATVLGDGGGSTSEFAECRTPSADLALTNVVNRSQATVGDSLSYKINVVNGGVDAASDVVVSDQLPAGLELDSATSSQGSCTGSTTITCAVGTLPAAAGAEITITGTASTVGTLLNTATATAATPDPDRSNNNATATVPITSADVSLTKDDAPDPLTVGDTLGYTLTVRNAGPSAALGVRLTDTLNATTTFVSAASSQGTCSGAPALVCELGTLAAGAQTTIVVRATPHAAGTLANTATVTSDTPDPNQANNNATATTEVTSADLSLAKADAPDPINVGDALAYTLTVRNAGPSTAVGVRVRDALDPTTAFVSATASQGNCSGAPALACELGALPAGAQATVVVRVTPRAAGPLSNAASVTSATFDPNAANNSAATTTEVTSADLSIETVDAPDPSTIGATLVYTLSVFNAGPSPAVGVRVTDSIATAATFMSATSTSGTCTGRATVRCDLGSLAAGGRASIQIDVTPRSAGTLANVVSVASTTHDPDVDNNSALASTRVTSADLSATVTAAPRSTKVGRLVKFTVRVENRGPTAASKVALTLAVPDGATITGGRRCSRRPTVRCNLGTLGVRKSVVVAVGDRPRRAGAFVTTARVGGSDFDPNARNNADSAKATARFLPRLSVSPPIGPPGFVTLVVGAGFPPSSVVALRWSPGLGGAFVRTSATGGLRAPLLVLPNDFVGPRLVVASGTSPDPGLKFAPATARFLVVPGRFLPAGFVERR